MTRHLSIFAIAAVLTVTTRAFADDVGGRSRTVSGPTYQVDPRIDLPVVAIGLTVAFGWTLGPQLAPAHCAPLCDRADVWALDRYSAGRYDLGWKLAGDVGVAAQFALAAGTLLVTEGWQAAALDALVISEAVTGAIALSIVSNTSTRRPRPHLYGTESPESERLSGTASLSFFSGHTAGAFAAAVGLFETLRRRHPGRASNYAVLAVGLAGGLFIGSARVLGGQHFTTDVLAGAVVGTSMGFLVPALHTTAFRIQPTSSGLSLALTTPIDL